VKAESKLTKLIEETIPIMNTYSDSDSDLTFLQRFVTYLINTHYNLLINK